MGVSRSFPPLACSPGSLSCFPLLTGFGEGRGPLQGLGAKDPLPFSSDSMQRSPCLLWLLAVTFSLVPRTQPLVARDLEGDEQDETPCSRSPVITTTAAICRCPARSCRGPAQQPACAPASPSALQPPHPPRLGEVRVEGRDGPREGALVRPLLPVHQYWLLLWEGSGAPQRAQLNSARSAKELKNTSLGASRCLRKWPPTAGESRAPGPAEGSRRGRAPTQGPCGRLSRAPRPLTLLHAAVGVGSALALLSCSALVWHFCLRQRWGCPRRGRPSHAGL